MSKEYICHLHINANTLASCESCREKVRKMTVASKFQEITDAELTAEINRRRQAKIEAERKAREEKNQHIASLISAAGRGLVNFVAPAHRKGDQCTDLSHWNGFSGDCLRCTMLDIIDSGDTPSNNVELDLKITVKKIDG